MWGVVKQLQSYTARLHLNLFGLIAPLLFSYCPTIVNTGIHYSISYTLRAEEQLD